MQLNPLAMQLNPMAIQPTQVDSPIINYSLLIIPLPF